MQLGVKVRQLRLEMGWSQQKLADKVGIAGSYISRLERDGFQSPSADILLRLAGALETDVEQLYQAAGYIRGRTRVHDDGVRPLEAILREAQEHCELLKTLEVPIRGKVPATYPLEEESNGYILIPKEVLGMVKGKVFGYRCDSDCLMQDGILPGDYIIYDSEAPFVDGQIYVVRVENRVAAKHIYLAEGNKLRLVSSGGEYEEIDVKEADIIGRVILSGAWRKH